MRASDLARIIERDLLNGNDPDLATIARIHTPLSGNVFSMLLLDIRNSKKCFRITIEEVEELPTATAHAVQRLLEEALPAGAR